MSRRTTFTAVTAMALVFGIAAASSSPATVARSAAKAVQLSEATMIVEVNATDGDAGLQVFFDGDAWRSVTVTYPNGETLLAVNTKSRLRNYGLTELFSESSEPPFTEFPLRKFKKLFPEGRYSLAGTTIEGKRLVGKATLSHDIPAGPQITSPAEGATVAPGNLVVTWNPVPETKGVNITGYRVIVERENPLRVFQADLPASATSVTVSKEFLQSGVEHKVEVMAIEASGNQTLTERPFKVS